MSRHLRTWVIGCAVLIAVASGWAFILRENARGYQHTVDEALQRSRARAVVFREFVDAAFSSVGLALRQFDVRPDVTGIVLPQDRQFIQEVLRRTVRAIPMFFSLAVADGDGKVVLSVRDDATKYGSIGDRDYFTWHRHNRSSDMVVAAALRVRINNEWAIPVSMRVEDEGGRFAGIVFGTVRPDYFLTFMRSLGVDDAAIVLRDGAVLVRAPQARGGPQAEAADTIDAGSELMGRLSQETAGTYVGRSPFGGAVQAASYSSLKSAAAAVYVGVDLEKELAPWRDEMRSRMAVGAAFTVLAVLFAAAIIFDMRRTERLTQDLRAARDQANEVRDAAEHARARAEEADLNKSNFLAHTSHELRTPLNAIIGFAEIITQEALGPLGEKRYREYGSYIQQSGEQLLGVVNNILDLAQATSGRWELRHDRFAFVEVLDDVWRVMAPLAATRSVALRRDIAPGLPDLVTERRVVRQILLNLLSNAVKFTMAGGTVTVTAALAEDGALFIRVRDTGIGIDPKVIDFVAQPFSGFSHLLARKPGTSGLGLPLCRIFAELLGGSLTIDSRLGEGTTVIVMLPANCLVPPDADAALPVPGPRRI